MRAISRPKYHIIIPFLLPALGLYALFVIYPYIQAMYISLTKWRGLTPKPTFVGLENFRELVGDEFFWNAMFNNLTYLAIIPIITISIALFLAFFLTHGKARFAKFYRIVFFFPQLMSLVALGVLWSFVYHPTIGILNGILESRFIVSIAQVFGFSQNFPWLGNPNTALYAIAVVVIWQSVGFYMVLFIAGMESIPVSYYEAATIDGANRWHLFWRITIPLLWDSIRTSLVFLAITATNMFAITQTMTQGGPNRSTDVLSFYVYERAFLNSRFGYATAVAIAMFALTLTLSLLTMSFTQRENLEY